MFYVSILPNHNEKKCNVELNQILKMKMKYVIHPNSVLNRNLKQSTFRYFASIGKVSAGILF